MSLWVQVDGSPRYREDSAGGKSLDRTFWTDVNTGRTQATAHGLTLGATFTWESLSFTLTSLDIANSAAHDVVTASYLLTGSNESVQTRDPAAAYNDGRIRRAGDEEWSVEFGVDQQSAQYALSFAGAYASDYPATPNWGLGTAAADTPVVQPAVFLLWKKWLSKATGRVSPAMGLPGNKSHALTAIATYIPGGTGGYEGSPRPRVMHVLGDSTLEAKFLCVGIQLEADGDLVCRVARYQHLNMSWRQKYPNLLGPA